jgi:hypothetical protein
VGKGRGGMERTHCDDDDNDYRRRASLFAVVVLSFVSIDLHRMVAMLPTRRGPWICYEKQNGGMAVHTHLNTCG